MSRGYQTCKAKDTLAQCLGIDQGPMTRSVIRQDLLAGDEWLT
jgi:hypothetical protein